MKKTVVSIVLGFALLAACPVSGAEQNRALEPRWGLRPQRSTPSSPLDLARWLARRLSEGMGILPSVSPAPSPEPSPVTPLPPVNTNEVCDPERSHCPTG